MSFSNNLISSTSFINNLIALPMGHLNEVSKNAIFEKKVPQNGYKFKVNLRCGSLFDKISVKSDTISFDKISFMPYSIVFISSSFTSNIALSINRLNKFDKISYAFISALLLTKLFRHG